MELKDLFVSYKQVDPVSTSFEAPFLPTSLYFNYDRASKAVSGESSNNPDQSQDISNQKVGETEPKTRNWVVDTKKGINTSEDKKGTDVHYTEGVRPNSESEKKSNPSNKTDSTTLQQYRDSLDYQNFKQQLDTFISNNAQYASIKDSLDYLAALESRYQMKVENYQGSKALGWFQFMDNTRKSYNNQTRQQFANDAQAQLLTAARYYTDLQNRVRQWGGDPDDFVTMYGAWWRPESARQYIQNGNHNYRTIYNEDFLTIRQKAQDLLT